jgi:hypothetical protein
VIPAITGGARPQAYVTPGPAVRGSRIHMEASARPRKMAKRSEEERSPDSISLLAKLICDDATQAQRTHRVRSRTSPAALVIRQPPNRELTYRDDMRMSTVLEHRRRRLQLAKSPTGDVDKRTGTNSYFLSGMRFLR